MRYKLSENTFILCKFPTGRTVTIALYKLSDGSAVGLTSDVCAEISTLGVYKWNTSNIAAQPEIYTEYLWIATDTLSAQYGKLVLGGYPDLISTADDILDEAVEGAYTMRQALRIMLASLAGKATGGGTATIVFRDINDSKNRITATVDINGNRSVVALDVT